MLGTNLRKLSAGRKLFAFAGVLLLSLATLAYSIGLRPPSQLFASPAQTISFDGLAQTDHPLQGQYPTGVIDWGQNTWEVMPPSETQYPHNVIQFADQGMRKASFTFLQPEILLQFDAYNGGGSTTATVLLSCAGLPNVSASIAPEKVVTVKTGWDTACSTPTLHSSNGWNMLFDNFMIAPTGTVLTTPTSKPISSPIPTPTPTSSPAPTPKPTSSPTPTTIPTQQPTPTPASTGGIWKPTLNTSWQWQLTTPVDQSLNVQMYDIDGFDNSASVVAALHAQGKKVVCYIDAGTYEDWRSDANKFPSTVKGAANGWPGERWLDIRNLTVLEPIMQARLNMCQTKGFDGVEFDNVDGYTNNTGFPLTSSEQITYNSWLASQAHARGLSAGLKNDVDQVTQLLPDFDWALDEQCFQYSECNTLLPFINAGKAVFEVEYSLSTDRFCPQANAMNFNSLKKDLDLTASRVACR